MIKLNAHTRIRAFEIEAIASKEAKRRIKELEVHLPPGKFPSKPRTMAILNNLGYVDQTTQKELQNADWRDSTGKRVSDGAWLCIEMPGSEELRFMVDVEAGEVYF